MWALVATLIMPIMTILKDAVLTWSVILLWHQIDACRRLDIFEIKTVIKLIILLFLTSNSKFRCSLRYYWNMYTQQCGNFFSMFVQKWLNLKKVLKSLIEPQFSIGSSCVQTLNSSVLSPMQPYVPSAYIQCRPDYLLICNQTLGNCSCPYNMYWDNLVPICSIYWNIFNIE